MTTRRDDGGRDAAVYCRISRDSERNGLGVERQEKLCRQLAKRLGWRVAPGHVFVDNDLSAFSGKRRPQFEAMVDAIKDGEVTGLVAYHPDRVTRSPVELEGLIDLLDANRVEVQTVIGGAYDLSNSTGRMQARIVGAVARQSSEQTSERIKDQQAQAAERGRWHGGNYPYGVDVERDENGKPVKGAMPFLVEHEAAVVREMAEAVLEGRSLLSIERELNRRGVPAAGGGRWHYPNVRRILVSPATAGKRKRNGQVVGELVDWPAILDVDTWEAVGAVLSDRTKPRRRAPHRYLLTNFVWAASTGERMQSKRERPDRGIQPKRGYYGPGAWIDAAVLEAFVEDYVLDRMDHVTLPVVAAKRDVGPAGEIARLQAKRDALVRMFNRDEIDERSLVVGQHDLDRQIDKIRQALADTPTPTPRRVAALLGRPGELRARWDDLDFETKRAVFDALGLRVEVAPARNAGPRSQPVQERVDVQLTKLPSKRRR
jgi:DNA invertase Pin-like site-specific DNA recombinase